ncbi:UDP-glucose 4-epimerase GalE [Bacillus sp. FJAT-29937]|uniref:UDP-glucose 4-epimerase GalE n=1 Tax=Bacillus sp. FJAT-29937 TaxID=1720553 RepID=UPI000830E96C|nr:UDP-glucose 4-epimerase GalE [Bacillus sp. FJAT-29937]
MILVIGGAGYIGSHLVRELVETEQVVILDNLSTGHEKLLIKDAIFVKGDLGDSKVLGDIFNTYPIKAVMHFAANSLVGESIKDPYKYYQNNVASALTFLHTMLKHDVKNVIFSSTAATYGIPNVDIIDEACSNQPINPYGRSKLMIEQILEDFSIAYGLNYIVLRYFNAAGAHISGEIGEDHIPETHLIPLILEHLLGLRDSISIFGSDYDSKDGTCIRDYVHVTDLARAHILALNALMRGKKKNTVYNLGSGKGYSVNEIIDLCESVSGLKATRIYADRRPGDPAKLVASYKKVKSELGWDPKFTLEEIIRSAWKWHRKNGGNK